MGVSQIHEDDVRDLTSGKTEVDLLETRLLLNGETIAYEAANNIFYIPQNIEKETLQGTFSLKEKTIYEKIYLIAPDVEKTEAVADNIRYKICYIDKKNSTYQIADIVFSGLPIMNLDGNTMRLYSAESDNIQIIESDVKYEQRGASTYYYEKKSYNLKLQDENRSLVGLRSDDDWILNALYDDIGLIHNQLSYQLWNEMASLEETKGNCTVNQEYIELLIDGEYQGVYALTERGDTKQFRMSEKDILFKVKGYPYQEGRGALDLKNPKESTLETDSLKDSFMQHFCEENDLPIENSLILLDYENSLDYSLFCQIATATDNTIKNSFIIGRKTGDYYKLCEVPWDCNMTWGIKNYVYTNEDRIYDTEFMSLVIRKLYEKEPERINRDIANRWFYFRENVFSEENITAILDENFSVLHNSGAYERNYQRWPEVSLNTDPNGTLLDVSVSDIIEGESVLDVPVSEIWKDENIYHFVDKRLQVLDEYYNQYVTD